MDLENAIDDPDIELHCDYCGYRWHSSSTMTRVSCSSCSRKTPNEPLAYVHTTKAEWLFDGCESIDEMKQRLDEAKEELSALQDIGFELDERVLDDEVTLRANVEDVEAYREGE